MTDPIADMLTRIRNALAVRKSEVILPYSKLKFNLAKILEKDGWIEKAETERLYPLNQMKKRESENKFKQIKITLKYNQNKEPAIKLLRRVSKPGQRIYAKNDKLPKVLNDFGVAIISTPQGLMTNKEARRRKIGGEVLCEVW